MGIDFYAGCEHEDGRCWHDVPDRPHWAYGGFHRFRSAVAAAVGIELDQMQGFRVSYVPDVLGERSWDDVPEQARPLTPFLNHSDCDGELGPVECGTVAPALREAIERAWPGLGPEGHDVYDRCQGLDLVELMTWCAEHHVPLVFC
jgi:hypothetical protein